MLNSRCLSLSAFDAVRALALAAALFFAFGLAAVAQGTMQVLQNAPGFNAASAYQNMGNGESINLANGGLTVTHSSVVSLPENMGGTLQPVRAYNGKDPQRAWCAECFPAYPMESASFLGYGWTLSYGRVFLRTVKVQDWVDPSITYRRALFFYQDESGAEHRLYWNGDVDPSGSPALENYPGSFPAAGFPSNRWYLTNDSSYIRAKFTASPAGGTWSIYFPDGSVRVAGGQPEDTDVAHYSYVPPALAGPDGGPKHVPYNAGWYVTEIRNRVQGQGAPNTIHVHYRKVDAAAGQPYPGSIDTIQDQFSGAGRPAITLLVWPPGDFRAGLLQRISQSPGGPFETFDYQMATVKVTGSSTPPNVPVLASVTDSASMVVSYSYSTFSDGAVDSPYLSGIGYPSGALSMYDYGPYTFDVGCIFVANPNQKECNNGGTDTTIRVNMHSVSIPALSASGSVGTNTTTWTYYTPQAPENLDTYLLTLSPTNRPKRCYYVKVTDPYGTDEVHFFSAQGNSVNDQRDIIASPGKEIAVIRYQPGEHYNPSNPNEYKVSEVLTYYDRFDRWDSTPSPGGWRGDAHRCYTDSSMGPTVVYGGNLRPWKTIETEFAPQAGSSTVKWSKTTQSTAWDGFGHYGVTAASGTGLTGSGFPVSARTYDLVKDLDGPLYQLDRLTASVAGEGTLPTDIVTATPSEVPPSEPPAASFTSSGTFKAVTQEFNGWGLLSTRRSYATAFTPCNYDYGSMAIQFPPTLPTNADQKVSLGYDGSGNIQSAAYALGDLAATYSASYTWQYGMVHTMTWGDETTTRDIDLPTGRIMSHTGPDGVTTNFEYDDPLGRLTAVRPEGENALRLKYTTGLPLKVKMYKGPAASVPELRPVDSTSSLAQEATYAVYEYDGLGRLWKTDSVMPDGTWTEQTDFFGPLGEKLFSSEPYAYPIASSLTVSVLPSFNVSVPTRGGACPYGTWQTPFEAGTCTSPFPFLTGSRDDLYRTLRVIKPDGFFTSMAYDGLTSFVTVTNQLGPQTTRYTKDVLGRLRTVTPPSPGASAAYFYDGLSRLKRVELTSGTTMQPRSFTYDALGHLLSATNPENGTLTYTTGGLGNYDALGNLLSYTDARGQKIDQTYDFKGRLTQVNIGSQILRQWFYDKYNDALQGSSMGKLVHSVGYQQTNFNQVHEGFWYGGPGGRLSQKDLSVYGDPNLPPTRSFQAMYGYGSMGELTGETAYSVQGTPPVPTQENSILSSYRHGALVGRRFTDGKGVGSETDPSQMISYHPSMALAGMPYISAGGTRATFSEDAAMARLKGIGLTGPYAWSTGDYQYDGAGNITQIGTAGQNNFASFQYDGLNRLSHARVTHDTSPTLSTPVSLYAVTFDYTIDGFGNLTGRHIAAADIPGLQAALGTDAAPFLLSEELTATMDTTTATNRITSTSYQGTTKYFHYDANGNTLSTDSPTTNPYIDRYTYNALNLCMSARYGTTNPTDTETYLYNADGERVASRSPGGTNPLTSYSNYFLRSGSQVLLEERNALSNGATATTRKAYLYVGGNVAATEDRAPAASLTGQGAPPNMCATTYAQNAGLPVLPGLSDPVITATQGQKFVAAYALVRADADLAGALVQIARVKGNGENGRLKPEDKGDGQQVYFLAPGQDAAFVFRGFGLSKNGDYGAILPLSPGAGTPFSFDDLKQGETYLVTLTVWTSVGADPTLGFNRVQMEESVLLVPKDRPSTHLAKLKRDERDGGGDFKAKLRVTWAPVDAPGVVAYDIVGKDDGGQDVHLNDQPVQGTEFEAAIEQVWAKGLTESSAYTLKGLDATGAPVAAVGPPQPVTLASCASAFATPPSPVSTLQAFYVSPSVGSSFHYVSWSPGTIAGASYKVYVAGRSDTRACEDILFGYALVSTTTGFSFKYVLPAGRAPFSAYCFKVVAIASDGVTASAPAFASSDPAMLVVPPHLVSLDNLSSDFAFGVQVNWAWENDSNAGCHFVVQRAELAPGDACAGLPDSAYVSLWEGFGTTTYMDTLMPGTGGSGAGYNLAYRVAVVASDGSVLKVSACMGILAGQCFIPLPGPADLQGSYNLGQLAMVWTWTANPAKSYLVYEGDLSRFPDLPLAAKVAAGPYIQPISSTSGGRIYLTLVAITNTTSCRDWPVVADALVWPSCPSPPPPPSAPTLTPSGTSLVVSWTGTGAVGGYRVYRGEGNSPATLEFLAQVTTASLSGSYTDQAIAPGVTYTYAVSELSPAGCESAQGPRAVYIPTTLPGQAATPYYYLWDHVGTTRVVMDGNGNLKERHNFEPFGVEMRPTANTTTMTHLYTGQERDANTGLDYMHFRFYGSNMGRFMKPDNINGDPMNPQSWNLYSYVGNNPVNRNDPTGHMTQYSMPQSPRLLDCLGNSSGGEDTDNPEVHAGMVDSAIQLANVQAALKTAGQDVTGSNVVYDAASRLMYIFSGGQLLGAYPMSHNVAITDKAGKHMHNLSLGDGTYSFLDTSQAYTHGEKTSQIGGKDVKEDSSNGAYGPAGIFRLDPAEYSFGLKHPGIGIHSGMLDQGGFCHVTAGCFRTTEEGMAVLVSASAWLPLNNFYVVNESHATYVTP